MSLQYHHHGLFQTEKLRVDSYVKVGIGGQPESYKLFKDMMCRVMSTIIGINRLGQESWPPKFLQQLPIHQYMDTVDDIVKINLTMQLLSMEMK